MIVQPRQAWALTLLWGASAARAADEPPAAASQAETPARRAPDVRNRFMAGLWFGASQATGRTDLELILSDALTAGLVERDGLDVDFVAAGRLGIRLFDGVLDDPRIRALGVHLTAGRWTVDLGRFSPLGGGWRLVDGVQARVEVGKGVQVGAWAGFGPEPYTTAPALRYGGGPVLAWFGDRGEFTFTGDILATPEGLDRLGGIVRGRVEISRVAEIAGVVDVQAGDDTMPVRLADASLVARLDPHAHVRLDLTYDAWSSLTYLRTTQRDPAVTRFAARSQAMLGDPWIPQDQMDPTVYQMAGAHLVWRPTVGKEGTVRLLVDTHGRYRYHDDPLRRFAHAGLNLTLVGLAAGRLDVGLGGAFQWWQDQPGGEGSARLWAQLDRKGRVGLDMSGVLILQPLVDTGLWTPSIYADAFLDAYLTKGVSLGAGYMLTNTADLELWDTWHGGMLRLSWHIDARRRVQRPDPEAP